MWEQTRVEEEGKGMAVNGKGVGLHATAGILIAFLIITSVAVSSWMMPSLRFPGFAFLFPPATDVGTLIILLTDAPVNLTHLNVTIDSISAHREGFGNETWVNLDFVGGLSEVYVDLLALQNEAANLSATEVPVGNYTMIRMHIRTANATYADGNTTELEVPSEDLTVIIHFEIKEGEERWLLIDVVVTDWIAISKSGKLRPVLKATILS
ncbi:MAG: DUF4382 domain-containing protein [Candidatus Bathyarchaeota archaeon]|nr:MAG: DUF4382 domain-containing protein [Candidatus Bathyarchaeota archaeon]